MFPNDYIMHCLSRSAQATMLVFSARNNQLPETVRVEDGVLNDSVGSLFYKNPQFSASSSLSGCLCLLGTEQSATLHGHHHPVLHHRHLWSPYHDQEAARHHQPRARQPQRGRDEASVSDTWTWQHQYGQCWRAGGAPTPVTASPTSTAPTPTYTSTCRYSTVDTVQYRWW